MRGSSILVAVAAIAGQSGSQTPASPAQPPVFRSTTRLVQINVVVHDKHGQPVTDLKKEDFVVIDRGQPQPISFFSMDSASGVATPPPAPIAPDVFTNL